MPGRAEADMDATVLDASVAESPMVAGSRWVLPEVIAVLAGVFLPVVILGCGGHEVVVDGEAGADAGADHGGAADAHVPGEASSDDAAVCLGTENRDDAAGIECSTDYGDIYCVCYSNQQGECDCPSANYGDPVFTTCPCCPSPSQTMTICAGQ